MRKNHERLVFFTIQNELAGFAVVSDKLENVRKLEFEQATSKGHGAPP
jgi:hypothetical protein